MLSIALLTPTQAVSVVENPVTSVTVEVEPSLETPLEIEQYIKEEALEKGLDPVRAQSIAWAESEFKKNARNPNSSASGVYQFINGTFDWYCIKVYKLTDSMANKNDVKIQVECALRMMKAGGESHWYASRHNWYKFKPSASQISLKSL